jgi:ketosteroid isomerase-like protein
MLYTEIERSKDCGNSPKNQLVEDLAIALSTGDHRTVSRLVTDDAQWTIVGGSAFRGREAILQAIEGTDGGHLLTSKII